MKTAGTGSRKTAVWCRVVAEGNGQFAAHFGGGIVFHGRDDWQQLELLLPGERLFRSGGGVDAVPEQQLVVDQCLEAGTEATGV